MPTGPTCSNPPYIDISIVIVPLDANSLSASTDNKIEGNKKEVAYKLLEDVGIDKETADRRVNRLSGGEQQRTAIARALSTDPEIIMADEPTGNLDHETSGEIIDLLMELAHEKDKCVIVVTHDLKIAEKSDVILQLDTKKKGFTIYN